MSNDRVFDIYRYKMLVSAASEEEVSSQRHKKNSIYSAVSYQAQLISLTHLRQRRFMEVQLQPHDHIWEISGVETHDIFGDPGRSVTAVQQQTKTRLLI